MDNKPLAKIIPSIFEKGNYYNRRPRPIVIVYRRPVYPDGTPFMDDLYYYSGPTSQEAMGLGGRPVH